MIVIYKAVCGLISVGILCASLVCVVSSYTTLYLGVVDIIVVAVSHQKDILSHIKRNLVSFTMSFSRRWCDRVFAKLGGHSNHENHCTSHILLDSSPVPSSLKNLLPFRVAGKITTVVTTRSASNWIREGSTTVSGQEAASQEAIDTAKEVGSLQDFGESEADESKSVESPLLKRRRSQHVMNISARKAKITVHEESYDL